MHRIKNIFFKKYKMFEISVTKCTNATFHAITVVNRRLFWVRMCDVQEGLGVKIYLI